MKVRYEAQKRLRFRRRIYGSVTTMGTGYWWHRPSRRWVYQAPGPCSSHFFGCRTVRAFRRRLRLWASYLPAGTPFILVARYVGQDVHGRIPDIGQRVARPESPP
jgi:hypothetical protein